MNDSVKSVLKAVYGKGSGYERPRVWVRGHRIGRWEDRKAQWGEERRGQSRETEREMGTAKHQVETSSYKLSSHYSHGGKTENHHNERLDTSGNRC